MFKPVQAMLIMIEYDQDMFESVAIYYAAEVRNFF